MDRRATYVNALTALTPQCAKIPIHFDTDREAIQVILQSLAMPDSAAAKVVRIQDTLSLAELEICEALLPEIEHRSNLGGISEPGEMKFDPEGNLG
jgi:hypothetical protein